MAAGIASIVLLVAGVFVTFGSSPNIKNSDSAATQARKYVETLSSSGHRAGIIIGAYLVVLAALAFVWFGQGIRARIASETAGRLVSALSVLGAAALTAGAMTSAVMAGAVAFGNEKVPSDGDTIRVVMDLFFPFIFVVFGLASAALIAVVAVVGRASALPDWMRYAAWVAVIGAIFGVVFFPLVLPLLWYLAFAITTMARPRPAEVATV